MEMEKLMFRYSFFYFSGNLGNPFFLYARRLRGYTATEPHDGAELERSRFVNICLQITIINLLASLNKVEAVEFY